ncbi:WGR domain-containing protein [Microvirga sesbaniae]|uniref:WGR domain-containing protein n=1 Tax=Microvirga sesbaniae TaxID=681392 RepID=UPI0029056AA4|nr:WGR domain-containing protein [Microvirga sp. HBU67692]
MFEAAGLSLIEPILVGPQARIRAAAEVLGTDIFTMRLADALHSHAAADKAVELVRAGEAEALMKRSLHMDEVICAVPLSAIYWDQFGTISLVHHWGRICTHGQELAEIFDTVDEAGQAHEAIARAKRLRGYYDL